MQRCKAPVHDEAKRNTHILGRHGVDVVVMGWLRCSLFEEPVAKKCGGSVVAPDFCMLPEDVCVCVLLRKDEAE
jgi:hypothetical protein